MSDDGGERGSFGRRLNEWLVGQGREPWPVEIVEALDAAAVETAAAMRESEKEIVAFVQGMLAGWQREARKAQERDHG